MGVRKIKTYGGQKSTYPIKDSRQINEFLYCLLRRIEHAKSDIKKYQAERNYVLVLIGFNTALRAEDLLQLRVVDVEKGYITIKENKTRKPQIIRLHKELTEIIQNYINKYELTKHDYMFRGQKKLEDGKSYIYPLTRQEGYKIVKSVADEIGLDIRFGLHSLRKTFGYQYIKNGGKFITLMKMYNHSDPTVTMRYVLWDSDDIEKERESIFIGKNIKNISN